jgi:hypothetical protein
MAGIAGLNPLACKLLFAYAYILFAITQIKAFTANRPSSRLQAIGLLAFFWNPYPWVEITMQGHFDILVALLCLGSVRTWVRGRDTASGMSLAAGALLKFLPIVLLPFLAVDRHRLRGWFLVVAVASIAVGLGASFAVWGPSTLAPIAYAATRRSVELSIFAFIRSQYSPLLRYFGVTNQDYLAPYVMFLALLCVWLWYWRRQPKIEAAATVAAMTMVLFHRTGYPQYHMVVFVLATDWGVRHWDDLRRRTGSLIAIGSYFAWLAVFEPYYAYTGDGNPVLYWMYARELVGLPAFLFGCAFIFGVVRAATPPDTGDLEPAA